MNSSSWTFIDLFAGIGGMRIPFAELGGACVFSSEWDEFAQQTYYSNFADMPAGDITKIDEAAIPDHDVLLAGFPCQPFSIIGNKQGFGDTRGTLFFDIERILRKKQPQAFLLENVRQSDDEIDDSFFASERIRKSRLKKCKIEPFYPSVWHENKGGNISVLPFSCALRAGASYNYLLVNGIRRPSSRELLRLQGFPESFKIVTNITQLRKQTGNSVAVPVIRAVAKKMQGALQEQKRPEPHTEQLRFFE